MGTLQQQLYQRGSALEQWTDTCHRREDEVERWKKQCRILEEAAQAESIKLDEIECERQNLVKENAHLKRKLEQREKELNSWKEDCMFFAVKFMCWGPSLLKWGPALHHEFERKLLQRRKNNSKTTPDSKLKANVVVGSLRNTFVDKSGALAVGHIYGDQVRDHSHDGSLANYFYTNKLWRSKKRKCVSCCSALSATGSASRMDFER